MQEKRPADDGLCHTFCHGSARDWVAVGEPPAARLHPSVFSLLPQLLERAGTGEAGSMTELFTVLVEADDMNDPIADAVRSILDGHIVLTRELAAEPLSRR
jgi:flagellar biosynthesis/type III secretory pathway ATPase